MPVSIPARPLARNNKAKNHNELPLIIVHVSYLFRIKMLPVWCLMTSLSEHQHSNAYGLWYSYLCDNVSYLCDNTSFVSGNKVIFTTTNKKLTIQLPDRTTINLEKADFSNTLFSVVCTICRDLRVRHPEELSLLR